MVNFYTKYINCPPANITADDTYATLAQVAGTYQLMFLFDFILI